MRSFDFFDEADKYFDLVELPILVLLPDGFIRTANNKLCQMLGYKKEELRGLRWQELIPKDDKSYKISHCDLNYQEQFFKAEESILLDKKGGMHILKWSCKHIKNNENETWAIVYSAEDVSQISLFKRQIQFLRWEYKKKLLRSIQQVQEKDRHAIALELHDNVGQILTACKLLLEGSKCSSDVPFNTCKKHIQTAIDEVRNISHRLNSNPIERKGFKYCVEEIIKIINGCGSTNVTSRIKEDIDVNTLDNGLLTNLFRIIQEHLNNILKHAAASEVSLVIEVSMDSIDIEIQDNGKGFNKRNASVALGLQNIYERVELFGGRAIFNTSPGFGCILSICVPVY